jgi:hypothetical protein
VFFPTQFIYQVYGPRLDDPASRTFEQCSSDSFQIEGPCASPICYAYLYRSGSSDNNGWKPENVKIYGPNSDPVTFTFNTSIPSDTWYGYNLWHSSSFIFNSTIHSEIGIVCNGFRICFMDVILMLWYGLRCYVSPFLYCHETLLLVLYVVCKNRVWEFFSF